MNISEEGFVNFIPLKCSRQVHATKDLEEHFMSELYGYIRVSTREQNDDRQRTALENFGVSAKNFFVDKQSGKDFARPQYRKLLRKIKAGDVSVATCLIS